METHSKNRRSGFTIIELMVAMSITAVIVLILSQVTTFALDTWRKSREEVKATRLANAALDTLVTDLASFVRVSGDKFQSLYIGVEEDGQSPSSGEKTPNAAQLIFATIASDRYNGSGTDSPDFEGGDVSVVNYRLLYRDPLEIGGSSEYAVYNLYRQRIDPIDSFDDIIGQVDSELGLDGLPKIKNLKDAIDSSRHASSSSDPSNFLVENVYEFTVTLIVDVLVDVTNPDRGTKQVRVSLQTINKSNTYREILVSGKEIETQPTARQEGLPEGEIRAIEIGVTVLTNAGIELLNNGTNISQAELLAEHSHQFTRTAYLPNN